MDTNDYLKLIASSLKGNALKTAYTIDPKLYLTHDEDETIHNGADRYLKELEKLFINVQEEKTNRLDFANCKQTKGKTILDFYSHLNYLSKAAKIEDTRAVKDRFIYGLASVFIKRNLLEAESRKECWRRR